MQELQRFSATSSQRKVRRQPQITEDLTKACIRLVIADSNDPDQVGFVHWRVAFYVAGEDGSALNFLSLFDDYLSWKAVF